MSPVAVTPPFILSPSCIFWLLRGLSTHKQGGGGLLIAPSLQPTPIMAAQEEADVKNADSRNSESETPKNPDALIPKAETRVDPRKSLDSSTHPKRVSTQPHHQARVGTRSNTGSPTWERKVSSEGSSGPAPSTPGRSRLRQVTLGDETPDDSTAVPIFGDWDDSDPASAEGYSHIFNKVREEKHGGGGKSPRITSSDSYFYGQRPEAKKGCCCFPWGKK